MVFIKSHTRRPIPQERYRKSLGRATRIGYTYSLALCESQYGESRGIPKKTGFNNLDKSL